MHAIATAMSGCASTLTRANRSPDPSSSHAQIWKNWPGDQRGAREALEGAGGEEERARVVAGAPRVKVAGSGHSFTDIACTDGVMVDLSGMNRLLDVEGEDVTVEAGIT